MKNLQSITVAELVEKSKKELFDMAKTLTITTSRKMKPEELAELIIKKLESDSAPSEPVEAEKAPTKKEMLQKERQEAKAKRDAEKVAKEAEKAEIAAKEAEILKANAQLIFDKLNELPDNSLDSNQIDALRSEFKDLKVSIEDRKAIKALIATKQRKFVKKFNGLENIEYIKATLNDDTNTVHYEGTVKYKEIELESGEVDYEKVIDMTAGTIPYFQFMYECILRQIVDCSLTVTIAGERNLTEVELEECRTNMFILSDSYKAVNVDANSIPVERQEYVLSLIKRIFRMWQWTSCLNKVWETEVFEIGSTIRIVDTEDEDNVLTAIIHSLTPMKIAFDSSPDVPRLATTKYLYEVVESPEATQARLAALAEKKAARKLAALKIVNAPETVTDTEI